MTDEVVSKVLSRYSQPIIFLGTSSLWDSIAKEAQIYFQLTSADLIKFKPFEGVKDLREKISQINLRPHSGRKRLFLIFAIDQLNHEQANTLLKTLEEPPPYAVILLFAQTFGKVLPTVKSRCHRVILAYDKLDSRSRLWPYFEKKSFAEFVGFIKSLSSEEIEAEVEGALVDIKQKSFNENMLLYRKLARCLIKVKSTNINPRLLLEETFIWWKANRRQ